MTRNESGLARPVGQKLNTKERERIRNLPDLGELPDAALAEREGVTKFTIARARRLRGIPPFAPARKRPPLSDISEFLNSWGIPK